MKSIVLAVILAAGLASSALAGSCPKLMKDVDAALGMHPKISAAQLAEVKALRAQGEAEHKGGKHAASVATLAKAKEILGIK